MEEFKKSYLKYKAILWPIITGISSLIILGFIVIPQFLDYLHTQDQISDILSKTDTLAAKAATLEGINNQEIKNDLQVAFAVLPTDEDVPQEAVEIQSVAFKDGLTVQSLSFAAAGSNSKSNQIDFKLSLLGSKTAVGAFLNDLKKSPGVYKVESLKATTIGLGDNLQMNIPITVYFDSTSKATVSLDQPVPKLSSDDNKLLSQLKTSVNNQISLQAASESSGLVPLGKADPFQ